MHHVAIVELAGPIEAEAAALAAKLGGTAYETRLVLASGFPAIVLTTPDRDRAANVAEEIRSRGHDVVTCDDANVVGNDQMVAVRAPRLDDQALTAGDGGPRLPYGQIVALLKAQHRRHTESRSEVTEKKLAPGRAILTGGLVRSTKVSREVTVATDDRELVLYLFRNDGGPPWLLRETGAQYGGLPSPVAPTKLENFLALTDMLRQRSENAVYDDRLMAARRVPERVSATGARSAKVETSSHRGMDLLAHLLAQSIARRRGDPPR